MANGNIKSDTGERIRGLFFVFWLAGVARRRAKSELREHLISTEY